MLVSLRYIMIEYGKSRWPVTVSTLALLCQMWLFECQISLVAVKGGSEVSSNFFEFLATMLGLLRHIVIECGKSRWPATVSTLALLRQIWPFERQISLVGVTGGF